MAEQQLTYDQIVEHIVQSKAIPNVVRVPDIVLDDSLRSESTLRPRYKPWESPQPAATSTNVAEDAPEGESSASNGK